MGLGGLGWGGGLGCGMGMGCGIFFVKVHVNLHMKYKYSSRCYMMLRCDCRFVHVFMGVTISQWPLHT